MRQIGLAIISALLSAETVSAGMGMGPCMGQPLPMGKFNQTRFIDGDWYEIYRDNGVWFQGGQDCVHIKYGKDEGWFTDIGITKQYYNFETGEHNTVGQQARFDNNGHGWTRLDLLPIETSYHILDTDYMQYAVVYGCDTWLFGLFHTEQSWLLSRDRDVSRVIKRKAVNIFAEEVPWYDRETQWMEILQGKDNGCVYTRDKPKSVDEKQFDKIMKEAEDAEKEEKDIDFLPTEDDPDADRVKPSNDNEKVVFENRREKADDSAKDFLKLMSKSPKFKDYNPDSPVTEVIETYYEDKMLGGGSILSPKYFGDPDNAIKTPVGSTFRTIQQKLSKEYFYDNENAGGYFIMKNIQYNDPQKRNEYVDVWLLTSENDQAKTTAMKAIAAKTNGETTCCWEDNLKGEGLKHSMTGIARIVKYTKDGKGFNEDILTVYDGEIKGGVGEGFGRLVNGQAQESFIGQLSDGKPYYKGLYYKGGKPSHMGIYDQPGLRVEDKPMGYEFSSFDVEKINNEKIKDEDRKPPRPDGAVDPKPEPGRPDPRDVPDKEAVKPPPPKEKRDEYSEEVTYLDDDPEGWTKPTPNDVRDKENPYAKPIRDYEKPKEEREKEEKEKEEDKEPIKPDPKDPNGKDKDDADKEKPKPGEKEDDKKPDEKPGEKPDEKPEEEDRIELKPKPKPKPKPRPVDPNSNKLADKLELRARDALQQVYSFVAMLMEPPRWSWYNKDIKYTLAIKRYFEEKLLAGGSILLPKYLGKKDYWVEVPMKATIKDYAAKLREAYQENANPPKTYKGGYYILRNIREQPNNNNAKASVFYDVWLLTKSQDRTSAAVLDKLNNTKTEKKYWNDVSGQRGLKNHVTGVARIIKYYKYDMLTKKDQPAMMLGLAEGMFNNGNPDGFARVINGQRADSFTGKMTGWKTANGRGVYFKSFKLVSIGTWNSKAITAAVDSEKKFLNYDESDNTVLKTYETEKNNAKLATKQAYGFIDTMQKPPDWSKYGDTTKEKTKNIKESYNNNLNGGGDITKPKYAGDESKMIETPFTKKVMDAKAKLEEKGFKGETDKGGFIILKDVPKTKGSDVKYDVWVYQADDPEGFKELLPLNNTAPSRTWEASADDAGIGAKVNGVGRRITYKETGGKKEMLDMYEGDLKEGKPKGFGRIMKGEDKSVFVGEVEEKDGQVKADGLGIYYKDEQFKDMGKWDKGADIGVKPTVIEKKPKPDQKDPLKPKPPPNVVKPPQTQDEKDRENERKIRDDMQFTSFGDKDKPEMSMVKTADEKERDERAGPRGPSDADKRR